MSHHKIMGRNSRKRIEKASSALFLEISTDILLVHAQFAQFPRHLAIQLPALYAHLQHSHPHFAMVAEAFRLFHS